MSSVAVPNRRRAVTLIEAVLFISVALGLIVGGIVFYQQAILNQRTAGETRALTSQLAELRAAIRTSGSDGFSLSNVDDYLIAAKAVPAEQVADSVGPNGLHIMSGRSRLRNAWGGEVTWLLDNSTPIPRLSFVSFGVPVEACSRLLVTDQSGYSRIGQLVLNLYAGDADTTGQMELAQVVTPPLSPSGAAALCTAADVSNDGLVEIAIDFLADG